jgi:hypothetical protein
VKVFDTEKGKEFNATLVGPGVLFISESSSRIVANQDKPKPEGGVYGEGEVLENMSKIMEYFKIKMVGASWGMTVPNSLEEGLASKVNERLQKEEAVVYLRPVSIDYAAVGTPERAGWSYYVDSQRLLIKHDTPIVVVNVTEPGENMAYGVSFDGSHVSGYSISQGSGGEVVIKIYENRSQFSGDFRKFVFSERLSLALHKILYRIDPFLKLENQVLQRELGLGKGKAPWMLFDSHVQSGK